MTEKPLAAMSYSELSVALREAKAQRQAADYQEGLDAWQAATKAADARIRAVTIEIDKRLDDLKRVDPRELIDDGR